MRQKMEASPARSSESRERFVVTLDVPKDIAFRATFRGKGNEDPTQVRLEVDPKRGAPASNRS
jgi:hypothetical protein